MNTRTTTANANAANTTRSMLAAVALVLATTGAAFAAEATADLPATVSQNSRAEVVAQAQQAVREGNLHDADQAYDNVHTAHSLRSRDAVRSEARTALRSGEIARLNSENWAPEQRAKAKAKSVTTAAVQG